MNSHKEALKLAAETPSGSWGCPWDPGLSCWASSGPPDTWPGHLILGFDVNTDFIRHMPEKQCPVSRSLIPENSQAPAESQGLLQGGRAAGKLSEHSVAQQTER
jgi:hypothetical protein